MFLLFLELVEDLLLNQDSEFLVVLLALVLLVVVLLLLDLQVVLLY